MANQKKIISRIDYSLVYPNPIQLKYMKVEVGGSIPDLKTSFLGRGLWNADGFRHEEGRGQIRVKLRTSFVDGPLS